MTSSTRKRDHQAGGIPPTNPDKRSAPATVVLPEREAAIGRARELLCDMPVVTTVRGATTHPVPTQSS